MSEPLFKIQQLACSYSQQDSDKVLYIENLELPRGELVFLLGASGTGKSTLLETLGLMNDTIASGSLTFNPADAEPSISIEKLWEENDQKKIAEVRKKHFSFIFQNTNLMENFTAYENICLSQMIQQDVSQQEAMKGAQQLMNKVNLPETQVGTDTLSVNLSGGQRQRVAFVRALNSGFSVLFCDEPTGNLDEGNANELMQILRSNLSDKLSAIVVSHDINLAMNHASRIVCLSKNKEGGHGEIKADDIFVRSDWEHLKGEDSLKFRERLRNFYEPAKKDLNPTPTPAVPAKGKFNEHFRSLFLRKEGRALSGKNYINLLVLVALLFFTFLAIGFANGSIAYLEKKMNNAFVNWLTVSIPWGKSSNIDKLKEFLNRPSEKEKYGYDNVTTYVEYPLKFWNPAKKDYYRAKGRSIEVNGNYRDPLLNDILEDKNRIKGLKAGFKDEKDLGLIVTERFLKDFNYPVDAPFVYMAFPVIDTATNNNTTLKIPIPIRAVVNEIPGKVQVAYTTYFYQARTQISDNTFDVRSKKNMLWYVAGNAQRAALVQQALKSFFDKHKEYAGNGPDVNNPTKSEDTYSEGYTIVTSFFPALETYQQRAKLTQKLLASEELKPYVADLTQTYDYASFTERFSGDIKYDQLSVNFKRLDKVREFASHLFFEYNESDDQDVIEVDIAKVKEKENFNFLSKVAGIISYLLIIFSTVSISLFIFNLLKMHLNKVKMNIGTFKAFGLSNANAQNIYFFIIIRFLLLSLGLAILLAYGAGLILDKAMQSEFVMEQGVSYFKLFDRITLLTVCIIAAAALSVSWLTIKNILSKSPGDLIYNR